MSTFTNAIAREIESRFGNGEPFSKFDLENVSNAAGKADRAITHVLREMHRRDGLTIVGETQKRKGGTQPSKIYARIVGARLVPDPEYRKFSHQEWQRETNMKEARLNECGIRLHQVLDGMTRARMAA